MRTKPARSDEERIRAFHEKLDQPSIVEIDDATAYWLEGEDGRQIGERSPTSEAPLLAALAGIRGGIDPMELSLVCNAPDEGAPDDGRYVISTGIGLLWMAESAAGLPPRPRGPAVEELAGRTRRTGAGREAGRHASPSRDGFGIVVDGAIGYSLRLTPSNKVLGRFASTQEAWPAVVAAVEAGRSPRMLVLDWHGADGSHGPVSSGITLEYLARSGLGLPAEHLRSPDQRQRGLR